MPKLNRTRPARVRPGAVVDSVEPPQGLAAILDRVSDGVLFCNAAGIVTYINLAAQRLSPDVAGGSIVGNSLSQLVSDAAVLLRRRSIPTPVAFETVHSDGQVQSMLGRVEYVPEDLTHTYRIVFHPSPKTQHAPQDSARLVSIVESSDDAIISKTLDGTITSWNKGAERIFGYAAESIIGRNITVLLPAGREEEEAEILNRLRIGERINHFDTVRLAKDGTRIEVSISISPIRDADGAIIGASKIARDISDRKRASAVRQLLEQRMVMAVDAAQIGIWDWDLPSQKIDWSARFASVFGTTLQSGTIEQLESMVHPDDRSLVRTKMQEAVDIQHKYVDEFRVLWPNGAVRWVEARGKAVLDDNGHSRRMTGTVIDITDRKSAQEAITLAEHRLKMAAEAAKIGFWERDLTTGQVIRSPEHARIMGITALESQYDPDVVNFHPDDREMITSKVNEAIRTGEPYVLECRIIRPDGNIRWLEGRGQAIYNSQGEAVRMMGTVVDISERKATAESARRRDAELAHLSRVSAMGNMASGLAHELNQPLGAILNYAGVGANMTRLSPVPMEKIQHALEEVMNETRRASAIISRLRSFVSKQAPKSLPVDLNDLVQKTTGFLDFEMREQGVVVNLSLAKNNPRVRADVIQIQQVLVNLMYNAAQAMGSDPRSGRRLVIENEIVDSKWARVSVIDTGPGMTAEQLSRLFEPFYTTKPQGLGMGLNISRSIVEIHGGRLTATVNPAGGMKFTFTLPLEPG